MLITEDYRKQNAELHRSKAHYGDNGHLHSGAIAHLAKEFKAQTILDYGCGRGTLGAALEKLGLVVREYDPAIDEKNIPPVASDIVACTDVLEHIEPECLNDVLDDLASLTRKVLFVSVHTGPAKKHLPDGRNVHLTQQPPHWWLERLMTRMRLIQFAEGVNGFAAMLVPHG